MGGYANATSRQRSTLTSAHNGPCASTDVCWIRSQPLHPLVFANVTNDATKHMFGNSNWRIGAVEVLRRRHFASGGSHGVPVGNA